MPYADWKIHEDDTLAAYLPESEFQGVLQKRLAIPPDHLAILIRDGKIVDSWQGAHFSVGGVWKRLKEIIGGKHALRLLVADLKPFPLLCDMAGITKDQVEVSAELAFEFQLNPEKPLEVMGLIANNRALTRVDVFDRIRPHIEERVLHAELSLHEAKDLRANPGLQDRIQAEIMKEVERVAGDLGLLVRAVSLTFGVNEEERRAVAMRKNEQEDLFAEFQHRRSQREMERSAEATSFRLRVDAGVERAKIESDHGIEELFLANELSLQDARSDAQRRTEMVDLLHGAEMARKRRLDRYDERLGDESNSLEASRIKLERQKLELSFSGEARRQKLELLRLEKEQEIALGRLEKDAQMEALDRLQSIEEKKSQAEHDRSRDEFQTRQAAKLEEKRLESDAELRKLERQSSMTPEQLLALDAGLSDEVARIFSEKARSEAAGSLDRESLLREMITMSQDAKLASEDQSRALFDKAMDRLAEVAAARVSRPQPKDSGSSGSSSGEAAVECPKCHHSLSGSDRFCKVCGHKMRTL